MFFFFNDTATTEIYTLSLHDALPISPQSASAGPKAPPPPVGGRRFWRGRWSSPTTRRSSRNTPEDRKSNTSELQSPCNLVCRLLLEKKNKNSPRLRGNLQQLHRTSGL